MAAILRGGPGDSQSVVATGRQVVWRSCLYEMTSDRVMRGGGEGRVYEHRPDCCEPFGRGAEDRCE
ncbi:hypothetical protein [Micromonospora pisi]|uniref:hypothetical protein n=1 Tax=Micromonospora pisi TaxID=589240 RepID=UPI000EB25F68|nr:hypothetical protein [Micromonospora pisi]